MICPATGPKEAARLAEAYRAAVEAIVLAEAPDHRHSVSIGIAQAGRGHARIEDWIHEADAALYEAKRRGRNCLVLSPAALGATG